MEDYANKLELRIDWSEIDHFGHINNLAIQKYVQAGRVHYMETVGLMQSQAEAGIGPILASTYCQFRKPLFYPGVVTVYSRVEDIKNSSFTMYHGVYDDQNEMIAEARDIIVLFDFNQQAKHQIPAALRAKFEALEKRSLSDQSRL